jgi:putative ABC transport system substrate-binding protein
LPNRSYCSPTRSSNDQRREFITLFGGATATAFVRIASAQPGNVPVVGFMIAGSRLSVRDAITAFESSLKKEGFIEGHNLSIEYRFADGQFDRLPAFAADLVRRPVKVLATSSPLGASAAMQATKTIPIVFSVGATRCKRV